MSKPRLFVETGLIFAEICGILEPVLPINGKRAAPLCIRRGLHLFLLPPDFRKGGPRNMVTYSDMIQLGILIVGIISLFIQANNKKK